MSETQTSNRTLDKCWEQPINQTVFDARDSPSRLTIVRPPKVGLTCCSGEIQFGHSPLGPASACIQCTVRSFARRHGLVETGSVRSLRLPRGTCERNFGAYADLGIVQRIFSAAVAADEVSESSANVARPLR